MGLILDTHFQEYCILSAELNIYEGIYCVRAYAFFVFIKRKTKKCAIELYEACLGTCVSLKCILDLTLKVVNMHIPHSYCGQADHPCLQQRLCGCDNGNV